MAADLKKQLAKTDMEMEQVLARLESGPLNPNSAFISPRGACWGSCDRELERVLVRSAIPYRSYRSYRSYRC